MKLKIIFLYLAVFMTLVSCITDDDNDSNVVVDHGLELSILVEGDGQKTRVTELGETALNENLVKTLDVYFFRNGNMEHYERLTEGLVFNGKDPVLLKLSALKGKFQQNAKYNIVAIANLSDHYSGKSPGSLTLAELFSIKTTAQLSPNQTQKSFLMDGMKLDVIVNEGTANRVVIPVSLQRALSKIRVSIHLSDKLEYAAEKPQYKVMSYASSANILASGIGVGLNDLTAQTNMTDVQYFSTGSGNIPGIISYVYENDWKEEIDRETFIVLRVPLKNKPENYYRIPVNYRMGEDSDNQNPQDDSDLYRLKRNHLYDISVLIDKAGTDTPETPLEIEGSYKIKQWTDLSLPEELATQNWLFVKEHNVRMINITNYEIDYKADKPVTVQNLKATYFAIDEQGNESTGQYTPSNGTYPAGRYPSVTANQNKSVIEVGSMVPINYVPLYMEFDVVHQNGILKEHVSVVQYPLQYLTVRKSRGDVIPEWLNGEEQGAKNFNLFTIHTLYTDKYLIGDPTLGGKDTDNTAKVDDMISPEFVVASQYGVYWGGTPYDKALRRCQLYGEDDYRSGWRLPTLAELEVISTIQTDPNSAIKALMWGRYYWAARTNWYYSRPWEGAAGFRGHEASGSISGAMGSPQNEVGRCIFDVYKVE